MQENTLTNNLEVIKVFSIICVLSLATFAKYVCKFLARIVQFLP